MRGTITDEFTLASTGRNGNGLPPPRLSREETDRLLRALTIADPSVAGSSSSPLPPSLPLPLQSPLPSPQSLPPQQKLKGREVLVPVFGGVAFYEGELRPESRHKSGSSCGKEEEEEEIVYLSTAETTKRSDNQQHQQQQQHQKPTEKDVIPVSLSDAIEWLWKNSTHAVEASSKSKTEARTKNAAASNDKTKPSGATNQQAAHGPVPSQKSSSMQPTPVSRSRSHEPGAAQNAVAGPMFNINEEYSADGTCIVGEAINLSSRLKAVYGDGDDDNDTTTTNNNNNPENTKVHHNTTPYAYGTKGEDSKAEAEDAPFDLVGEDTTTSSSVNAASTKQVSDEEYHQISKRLEQLALMEEEESKRKKDGRRKPAKPLGGGGSGGLSAVARIAKPKSKSSSFGFKKGFLNNNASASKKKATKTKPAVAQGGDATATATASFTSAALECSPKQTSGGVTIDVSQNKVHEIPREGKQQPVPVRKPPRNDQLFESPQPPHPNSNTNTNRLLDASVFSGQISERRLPIGASPLPSPSPPTVISADVAARVAANEQTSSLQHELEQQQRQHQQRQTRPKRVSRFKQQRQEEEQQR